MGTKIQVGIVYTLSAIRHRLSALFDVISITRLYFFMQSYVTLQAHFHHSIGQLGTLFSIITLNFMYNNVAIYSCMYVKHFHCIVFYQLCIFLHTIDPEEFLNLLFKHILHVDQFVTIR